MVHGGRATDLEALDVRLDRDVAALETERMAERDQFVRALCRHRAGDDCRAEYRALRRLESRQTELFKCRGRKTQA